MVSATWHVYLVECADGTLYCGVTTDPARRLAQHNGELAGGARYTRARRPVRLLAAVPCAGRPEAQRLEAAVKALPRGRKLAALLAAPGETSVTSPALCPSVRM